MDTPLPTKTAPLSKKQLKSLSRRFRRMECAARQAARAEASKAVVEPASGPQQDTAEKKVKASVGISKASDTPIDSDPFPLEELPSELLRMVIEHAPEAVLAMRQTCRKLQMHVDEFAVEQSTVSMIGKACEDRMYKILRIKSSEFTLMCDIPPRKSALFYLRLFLLDHLDFKRKISEMAGRDDEDDRVNWNFFNISIDVDDEAKVSKQLECLRQWWGGRIDTVQLHDCYDERKLEFVSRLLEGKRATTLSLRTNSLPGNLIKHVLQTIEVNKVERVTMSGIFSSADPVTFLLQLASKLRSIHIYQYLYAPTSDPTVNHLLGANDVDWAELIVDLFSGTNKLDQLHIENRYFPNYLSKAAAERLIDELPRLNKRISFTATCDKIPDGLISESHKDYTMRVTTEKADSPDLRRSSDRNNRCMQFLEIKHRTRVY